MHILPPCLSAPFLLPIALHAKLSGLSFVVRGTVFAPHAPAPPAPTPHSGAPSAQHFNTALRIIFQRVWGRVDRAAAEPCALASASLGAQRGAPRSPHSPYLRCGTLGMRRHQAISRPRTHAPRTRALPLSRSSLSPPPAARTRLTRAMSISNRKSGGAWKETRHDKFYRTTHTIGGTGTTERERERARVLSALTHGCVVAVRRLGEGAGLPFSRCLQAHSAQ